MSAGDGRGRKGAACGPGEGPAWTRRDFLRSVSLGGVGLALAGCVAAPADSGPAPVGRRVWLLSDIHATYQEDGRDGIGWLSMALGDLRDNVKDVAYALCLGDLTHQSANVGLTEYAEAREAAHIGRWYELAGNHDVRTVSSGVYAKVVGRPVRYCFEDGNAAYFMVSTEGDVSGGFLSEATAEWLTAEIRRREDRWNIIVATHHPVYNTVSDSVPETRHLAPRERVAEVLRQARVDLWVCGHVHSGRRTADAAVRRGRTTFVNVASIHHGYGTGAANSCLLEVSEGSAEALLRCREHDRRRYVDGQDVRVTFAHSWQVGQPTAPMAGEGPPAAVPTTPRRAALRPAVRFAALGHQSRGV